MQTDNGGTETDHEHTARPFGGLGTTLGTIAIAARLIVGAAAMLDGDFDRVDIAIALTTPLSLVAMAAMFTGARRTQRVADRYWDGYSKAARDILGSRCARVPRQPSRHRPTHYYR